MKGKQRRNVMGTTLEEKVEIARGQKVELLNQLLPPQQLKTLDNESIDELYNDLLVSYCADFSEPLEVCWRLGGALREFRTGAGMSIQDLARRTGVSENVIDDQERGVKCALVSQLFLLCAVLGKNIDALFSRAGNLVPSDADALKEQLNRLLRRPAA
jgi:DNA-binding XRE family transcriptional regulator